MIGVDSTKVLRPLLVDATGKVLISSGGANPVFHYDGMYHVHNENLASPAGAYTLACAAVPAGQVAVVTIVAARDRTSAIASCTLVCVNGALVQALLTVGALAANTQFVWNGVIYLPEGWAIQAAFTGVVLNDDTFIDASGYYMTL